MKDNRLLPLAGIVFLSGVALVLALTYRLVDTDNYDSIGYIQASHQLARGAGLAFVDVNNQPDRRYYTLYSFKVIHPDDRNRYFGFPPVVPLLAAGLEHATGDPGSVHSLVPIMAALLIVATGLLGMFLFEAWVGLWACLALFAAPIFLRYSSAFFSEIPSATFLYAGCLLVVLAWRRAKDDACSALLAGVGGLVIGVTFLMRFSNVTILPAIVVLIGLIGGRAAFKQRRTIWLIGSLCVALLALLTFNVVYYGGPFITGYSPLHGWYDQSAFSLLYAFGPSFVGGYSTIAIGRELIVDLGGLLLVATVGLAVRPRGKSIWLLILASLLLLPYAFYAFAAQDGNERFILPALPAICLLVGQGITAIGHRMPNRVWRLAGGSLLAILMLYNLPANLGALAARNQSAQRSVDRSQRLVAVTEPDAVILSYIFNDLIAVYGHRSVLNYRHIIPYDPITGHYVSGQFENLLIDEIGRLLRQGTPVYYALDRDPSLYDSYNILKRHFELVPTSDEILYRVQLPSG